MGKMGMFDFLRRKKMTPEEEIYNRLRKGMTYPEFLSRGGEMGLRATARRSYREQFPGGILPVAGGADRSGFFDRFRRKPKHLTLPGFEEKRIETIERELRGLRNVPKKAGEALGKAGEEYMRYEYGAPAYAKGLAESELFHIAERVTAEKYREAEAKGEVPKTDEVMDAIEKEIEKQFGKKRYDMEWFADKKGIALYRSLIAQGIRSGREQIRYYEREWGGRYPGQAVRKLEQVGAATSEVARRTGLYGKVRNTATQMEKLDPAVRSALNKARLELQRKSKAIVVEFSRETERIKKEAQPIEAELKRQRDTLGKTNREINEELSKLNAPSKQEGGGVGGLSA